MLDALTDDEWQQVDELLDAALDRAPEERRAFLAEACAGEPEIRRCVEQLLFTDAETPCFLDAEAVSFAGPAYAREADAGEGEGGAAWDDETEPGERRVGPYRLLEEAGFGGMSRVYRAERADGAFEQEVVVKMLPIGLDSASARERFQTERQILADLQHPHVARLLDGGVTDDDVPYLVLEYVEGAPITEFCDDHGLPVQERIELLRQVGEVLQFAHRNLIVHRDVKPANVLVTETSDGPQVKLLDFGIAKLLDTEPAPQRVRETQTGIRPMTPAYAAPEQVRDEAISAATDVYQFGVLAYELLSGHRPFEDCTHVFDVEQAVVEREPERPSVAVQTGRGDRSPEAVAEARGTSASALHRALRGDLDTVVQKALRKDPEQRYASVEAMTGDLERFLEGKPVTARPATPAYRAKKFVQRNRWGVSVAVAFVLLVAGSVALLVHQRNRAQQEAEKAREVSQFLTRLFRTADPSEAASGPLTARDLLDQGADQVDRLGDQPAVQAQMLSTIGQAYEGLGEYDRSQELLQRSLTIRRQEYGDESAEVAETQHALGILAYRFGNYERADSLLVETLEARRAAFSAPHALIAESLNDLAVIRRQRGELDDAGRFYREALEQRRELFGPASNEVATTLNNLAVLYTHQGDLETAESTYRRVLEIRRERLGPQHARVANTLSNLAMCLRRQGKLQESESTYRRVLEIRNAVLDADHPTIARTFDDLAAVLREQGRLGEAERLAETAYEMRRERFGAQNVKTANSLNNLATILRRSGQYARADSLQQQVVDIYRAELSPTHRYVGIAIDNRAEIHRQWGRCPQAVSLFREALAIFRDTGENRKEEALTRRGLGACLVETGQWADAETHLTTSYQLLRDAGDSTEVAETRRQLVDLYRAWGKPDAATRYQETETSSE